MRMSSIGTVGGRVLGVHVGARHDDANPLAEAAESGADAVQLFLADPQDWKMPKPHPRAAEIAATPLTVFVHAPYTINVATTNNRIRIPAASSWRRTRRWPPRWVRPH